MELDFEKLFRYLAVENSLLIAGVLSLLISIYAQYILGMKIGFFFLIFGAFLRFYNLSIVKGIFNNYLNKPKYREVKKIYNEKSRKYDKEEFYRIPFKDSWYIHIFDFSLCLLFLICFIYVFLLII